MVSKFKSVLQDYKLLLNNVPTLVTTTFVLSTVIMNIMAGKLIFTVGNVSFTGGFLLSAIPFLCMDCTAKRFGARAAIMLNILSAVGNIFAVVMFAIVAAIPTPNQDYTAFNSIVGGVWFISVSSIIAFVASGVANSLINSAIGKLFNKTSAVEFYSRSFVSTFIGQAIDNFLFLFLTYTVFAPKVWGLGPMTVLTCFVTAVIGGIIELLVEVVLGPCGFAIVKSWEKDEVGKQYIEAHKDDKL